MSANDKQESSAVNGGGVAKDGVRTADSPLNSLVIQRGEYINQYGYEKTLANRPIASVVTFR
jgi:hypothetical protein